MIAEIIEIIIESAEEAFLAVGVFVGAVLLLVGLLSYKQSGKLVESLNKTRRIQPIIGALLGLIPGCGGAIFVMPLYLKGTVSFGAVIAALVATMGDAAFVLISSDPKKFLLVSIISFIAAIIVGYIIDFLGIDGGFAEKREKKLKSLAIESQVHDKLHHDEIPHVGHENGDEADVLFHHSEEKKHKKRLNKFVHNVAYKIFWAVITIGFVFGVLELVGVEINEVPIIPNLGMYVGVGGTFLSLVYVFINKKLIKKDEMEEEEHKLDSVKETIIHDSIDVAFVITWVFAAFLVYNLTIYFVGGEEVVQGWLLTAGIMTVVVGALVGIIPGSGPQIIFVALFSKGLIPFAALLANALSQDGDARI